MDTLEETGRREGVTKTALIIVGRILEGGYERSKLYDPSFTTEFRKAVHPEKPAGEEENAGQNKD